MTCCVITVKLSVMGGAVSSGTSNSELVDNLCSEGYITRPDVERAFRVVDRADYMTFTDEGDHLEAYEDHAWRKGTMHISAPCIYTKAVEALEFQEGVSFLNIGSGTGYLSTMAGLLLGPTGVNHGVELCPENVDYATEKVSRFKESSQWYDPLTFCDPVFQVGNGLLMTPGHMQYDRVYCGAACPTEHVSLMKSLLKIGGILVFPVDNKLECLSRVGESEWASKVVLPSVSFASLVTPSEEDLKQLPLVEFKMEPASLKQLCRLTILRHVTRHQYPFLHTLPLPMHLKEYVTHYQEWSPVPAALPLQCSQTSNKTPSAPAQQRIPNTDLINGRRVLLCSVNGVVFQIPLESDDREDDEVSEDIDPDAEHHSNTPSDMDSSSHSDQEDHFH